MHSRREELARAIGDDAVLFSCEGVAEQVIIDKLVTKHLTFINRDRIITDPYNNDAWSTRDRSGENLARDFLTQDYGKNVTILCIQDQLGHRTLLRQPYAEHARTINVTTHPEIEMLIVYREGKLDEYNSWKSHHRGAKNSKLKPSLFCKEVLGKDDHDFRNIKKYPFLNQYWDDADALVRALELYRELASAKKQGGDFLLADLLNV